MFGIKVQSNSLNLSNSIQTSDEDGVIREETVLHEVLHLLKFDNFPTLIHNDTGFLSYSNRTSLRTRMPGSNLDVVYSCAIAAFPELERKYTRQIDEKLERSVQTCKAARIIGGRVDILARDLPFLRSERVGGDRSVICFLDQITHFYEPIVKPAWLRTIRSVCTPEK